MERGEQWVHLRYHHQSYLLLLSAEVILMMMRRMMMRIGVFEVKWRLEENQFQWKGHL